MSDGIDPAVEAARLMAVVAECAAVAGVDVMLMPLPEVVIRAGLPDRPGVREYRTFGVRLDADYAVVATDRPGRLAAYKIDGGRITLKLRMGMAAFAVVHAALNALTWDRLRAHRGPLA